ncbi:Cadmium, cobalt and zinc/H(+)-K(+) antiporter [Aquimixticola soesokkakensis]|uniref:Cadmium, cobalt and zinc/H(+)-K(+) antiporter n=1 Tax=Aquimixticola soesokkakensis TaxID=1519096 RepID=A0A1Y5SZ90_9RHOB|nr:cation diffusion facilitator family transporter [Aquimixticola soesokkakensis]SLN52359.1 Cadmium, cobalt and zinc/H(+)-K(+) antiporter [Aquimixticola soesokkakensis]
MPHDHSHAGHSHAHIDPNAGDLRVAAAIGVNLLLTVAQIIGGIVSGSMALIADAIHNLSDAVSLVIAFWARKIARKPRDGQMTFGYARAEVIAALINYTTLVTVSIYLLYEGVARLIDPPGVDGWPVVWLAAVALVIDAATALLTWKMAKDSVNIRAAFLHNLADALSSVAVIVAGILILLYDWRLVDPIVTIGIALYILWHAFGEVKPVISILMLGAPAGQDATAVTARLAQIDGVSDLHHVHLWQIDERRSSVEAHVVVAGDAAPVLRALKTVLRAEFNITHSTFEVEAPGQGCAQA